MKRPSLKQRLRQIRFSRWAIRKAIRKNRESCRKRPLRKSSSTFVRRVEIVPPRRLRFYLPREQRSDFESFSKEVSDKLEFGNDIVVIDFRTVEKLYPCGVLLLMGMVDDWCGRFPNRVRARYPDNDLVEQMLQHVGVLQKLGLDSRKEVTHNDVTRWHYFSGSDVDAAKIEPFMEKLGVLLSAEAQSGLYDCIAEAMTNVKHHAYGAGGVGRWWMFSTISDKKIFVAMYDRGASIPGTLMKKPTLRDFFAGRSFRGQRADGDLISAAAGGRTSTKLPFRGKGLPEMVEYTKASNRNDLAIYSRSGFYRLFQPIGSTYRDSRGTLGLKVSGTLLLWTINLVPE